MTALQDRLKETYAYNKHNIGNIAVIDTYLAISSPNSSDLDTLRSSLITLRDNYIEISYAMYTSLDIFCQIIELYDEGQGLGDLSLLSEVTPLGASAPSDLVSAVNIISNSIGSSALNPITLLGSTVTAPFNVKTAIDDIVAAIGSSAMNVTTLGASAPSDLVSAVNIISNSIGSSALNPITLLGSTVTAPVNVKTAIDDIVGAIGSTAVQVGTLGSFYSCTSISDTTPTLIATGSNTISGTLKAIKQCNNWASAKEFALIGASKIETDSNADNVYVSFTGASGSCIDVIGSLMTQSVKVSDTYGVGILVHTTVIIPAMMVTCSSGNCSTPSTYVDNTGGYTYTIPSLPVSCTGASCTTSSTTVTGTTSGIFISPSIVVPALTIGSVSDTAGSLYALCMYAIDH